MLIDQILINLVLDSVSYSRERKDQQLEEEEKQQERNIIHGQSPDRTSER